MKIYKNGRFYDFWLPPTKARMVEWMKVYYPKDKKGNIINWNKYDKDILTQIYIQFRIKLEDKNRDSSTGKKTQAQIEFDFTCDLKADLLRDRS